MALLELVQSNPRITRIVLEKTFVKPAIIDVINEQIRRNALAASGQRGPPNPTNHPLCIQMRALRRLFNDIAGREAPSGNVPKIPARYVVDGYKENMKMQARESELDEHGPDFFEELIKRASMFAEDESGLIGWENFLVVCMLPDVPYVPADLQRLREEFAAWDSDSNNYIDLRELKNMMTDLNGKQPTDKEVEEKLQTYDADNNSTVSFDEFVVMMYQWVAGVPVEGHTTRMAPESRPAGSKAYLLHKF
eukprot:NODE_335_length_980_cov_262.200700_g331_i0.p1 GENE.NODE_335_length_980_cov_262.200700_g331_i0~~NODE_335_length_980_cov_262.200700_g331_i0.p1  ORF type:complete len:291 (-),score=40.33 NODE_335_length_980_cov_262.200700_g331_i0:108-857(-)